MNAIIKSITTLFLLLAFAGGSIVQSVIASRLLTDTITEASASAHTEDSVKENETTRDYYHSFDISLSGFLDADGNLLFGMITHNILSAFEAVFSPPPNQLG